MRKPVFGFPTRYYKNLAVQGLQPQKMTRCLKSYLCMLARKLLVMPASSAAIERIFTNFGLIQTKLRNKLGIGIQKCGKLISAIGKDELGW